MELETIKVPAQEARRKFLEYRRAVRARHDEEDKAIMVGYRALAKGEQLIRLSETVRAGGTSQVEVRWRNYRGESLSEAVTVPRLAVCRADVPMVWTQGVRPNGQVEILMKRNPAPHNRRDRLVMGGFPEPAKTSWRTVRAIVPLVPPALRPAAHLRNYMVLFEAEWSPDPIPPVDPALLKHIGGDLYAVVAVWDLTELERAVLARRA